MSLLIRGMEMPKHAIKNGTDDTLYRSCVIVHPDGTAELIVDNTFADMFSFEHCLQRFPLVEIPTPHGRLIDANKLAIAVLEAMNRETDDTVIGLIDRAMTVIKKEEKK